MDRIELFVKGRAKGAYLLLIVNLDEVYERKSRGEHFKVYFHLSCAMFQL